jgi:ketosteroid isomerase-like protein
MTTVLERLRDAANAHDAQRLASLFADDYQSTQPLHPGRGFGGAAQVLENWSSVFEGVPDFSSELVASSVDGEFEWGEWRWHGHHVDGSPFAKPLDADGGDIEAAVQELYKPPPGPSQ